MSEQTPPRWRKRTARFVEIAELAGVSATTVDRVLNERGSVSAQARERVIAAAKQLAVPRVLPDAQHGLVHIDVMVPGSDSPFFGRLREALQRATQMLDRRVIVHRTMLSAADEARLPASIAHAGRSRHRRAALIVTAQDTPEVRVALAAAIARGEAVVTMVTDIGGIDRLHYAGIDNLRAGHTAGYFLGRFARPGRVLLLPARLDYRAHADRIAGCRAEIARHFDHLVCDLSPIESLDQDAHGYRAVNEAIRRGDLAGIYNTGYGSAGVEAALRKAGLAGKVVWIGHEMFDAHRQYIDAGIMDIVIDQDPDGQVISALQHALHACGIVEHASADEAVEFRVFCSANVRQSAYLRP